MIKKLKELYNTSNRKEHFLYGAIAGFGAGLKFTIGTALGMELKDKLKGGKFDWYDFTFTILGGIVGAVLKTSILFLMFQRYEVFRLLW